MAANVEERPDGFTISWEEEVSGGGTYSPSINGELREGRLWMSLDDGSDPGDPPVVPADAIVISLLAGQLKRFVLEVDR